MDIPKTDLPPDDVPQKGVNYFMLNSAKYNGQEGRKALHKIVEDALKKAAKGKTSRAAKSMELRRSMQSIGLIGLGNAGRPMAERILSAGL